MAKTLNGLVLPDQIQWIDEYEYAPVASEIRRTLGGVAVVYSQGLIEARPVTLEARDGVEWLTQQTVDDLTAIAETPGAQYTLDWNGALYTVMFRHHEPPVISFQPVWPEHDYYTGTIKLMTV